MELSYTLMGTQATIIVDLPKESKALVVEYGMCVLLNYVPSLNDMRFLGESGSNSETKQIDTTTTEWVIYLTQYSVTSFSTTTHYCGRCYSETHVGEIPRNHNLKSVVSFHKTLEHLSHLHMASVFHPKATTIQGGEEPFVSVKAKGVSSFHSVDEVSEFWANANAPSIGRIHVDPHSVIFCHVT
ncbi:hypothetical protein G4B88_023818 [Cannabis sativa]|uniref:Uncharacterized protein n=1 Tax=Cannabis sativa TaxID=3483 RepID=A0A7J6G2P2_CANSA|nr:hypothetical protein G4B88_023818 [Cannabis sativa]